MEIEGNASVGDVATAAEVSQVQETPAVTHDAPAERSAPSTRREALDKAFASLEAAPEPKPAPSAPADGEKPKAERVRNPDGTFAQSSAEPAKVEAAKAPAQAQVPETVPVDDAPSRFSPDAKTAWKDAPPAVRGEIKRAITELEGGLNQYREKLQSFDGLEQYLPVLQQNGKTIAQVFNNYVGFEKMVREDPIRGTMHLLSNLGISPHEVASAIIGQEPSQQAAQSDRTISELRQHISRLETQITGVSQTFQQQQEAEAARMLSDFAKDKPRFADLRNDMHFFISTGKAANLDEAYQLAERLNPAPQVAAPQPAPAPAQAVPSQIPAAQTRKAALSVTGSPALGSNPGSRDGKSSRRGALDNAFASVGLA